MLNTCWSFIKSPQQLWHALTLFILTATIKRILSESPFYRWEHWGSMSLITLPKSHSQQVETASKIQIYWFLTHLFLATCSGTSRLMSKSSSARRDNFACTTFSSHTLSGFLWTLTMSLVSLIFSLFSSVIPPCLTHGTKWLWYEVKNPNGFHQSEFINSGNIN